MENEEKNRENSQWVVGLIVAVSVLVLVFFLSSDGLGDSKAMYGMSKCLKFLVPLLGAIVLAYQKIKDYIGLKATISAIIAIVCIAFYSTNDDATHRIREARPVRVLPKENVSFPEIVDEKQENTYVENELYFEDDEIGVHAFSQKMEEDIWYKNAEYNFKFPHFFVESYYNEDISEFIVYHRDSVELCCIPSIGKWANWNDQLPVVGSRITKNAIIKSITLNHKSTIFSGYLNDGRIFYMKRLVLERVIPQVCVLVLAYPKEYQKGVDPLIMVVRNWEIN